MKLLFELDAAQIKDVYRLEQRKLTQGDIECALAERFGKGVVLDENEFEKAIDYALNIQASEICYLDIAEKAVYKVLEERPKVDLLNDILKKIGLETHTYFRIDDQEFKDQILSIDSFGDVFAVDDEYVNDFLSQQEWSDHEHDYLTLGRILTQYPDKIIPIGKEV